MRYSLTLLLTTLLCTCALAQNTQRFLSATVGDQSFGGSASGSASGTAIAVDFGLEHRLSPRWSWRSSLGLRHESLRLASANAAELEPEPFPIGIIIFEFANFQRYHLNQTLATLRSGPVFHAGRWSVAYGLGADVRFRDRFEVELVSRMLGRDVPEQVTTVKVRAGEEFRRDMATDRLEFDRGWRFSQRLEAGFHLTERLELIAAVTHNLSGFGFRQRVVRFCDTCFEEPASVAGERVDASPTEVAMGVRWRW